MSTDPDIHAAYCELVYDVGRSAGEVRVRVTGASMLPAIRPGDEITVRRCEIQDFQPGDVVLYRREGKLTAHRVQERFADSLIARGDSVPVPDLPIHAMDIVGKVSSISRGPRIIEPVQTLWQRMAASILRSSDLCLRITLYIYRRTRAHTPAAD